MSEPYYALVAYVSNSVGRFVEGLRRELQPEQANLPAHLSILPPRLLAGTEQKALEAIERVCDAAQPFAVTLGHVESFVPVTPTVFLGVAHEADRMRELHDLLNVGALEFDEPWPYVPHLTIFRMEQLEQAERVLEPARQRWSQYRETHIVRVDSLTFVRQEGSHQWRDLAPVPLGRRLVPSAGQ
jgi:2'-5' RNA ligase